MNPRFLNVDLDIESASKLNSLVAEIVHTHFDHIIICGFRSRSLQVAVGRH
jgi:hypothetical protein